MPDCGSPFHNNMMTKKHHMSESGIEFSSREAERLKKTFSTKSLPTLKENTTRHSLAEFLKKKSRVLAFRAFLQKEFSDENLDFWIEVEAYKKLKPSKLTKVAQNMYETYIKAGSQKEINIDATTRKMTESNLANPNMFTFDSAQTTVFVLMERDSFPRFVMNQIAAGCEHKFFGPRENKTTNKISSRVSRDTKKTTLMAATIGLVFHSRVIEAQMTKLGM